MAEVLVLVEHADGAPKKVTAELITAARALGEPSAVVVGKPGLSDGLVDSLKAAGAAIVVATAAHWLLILRELRTHGVNVDDAIARGACVLFDADVAPDGGRILEAIDRARAGAASSANPHPRVVLCGERAGRLWAAGRTADALRLEGLCHELPHDIDILCTYPVPDKHDDEVLARIRAMHTAVCAA